MLEDRRMVARHIGGALLEGERSDFQSRGAVALGPGAGAVDRLELIEVLCRTWRDALLVRAASSTNQP